MTSCASWLLRIVGLLNKLSKWDCFRPALGPGGVRPRGLFVCEARHYLNVTYLLLVTYFFHT